MTDVPYSDWLLLGTIILVLAILVFGFRALGRSTAARRRRLWKRVRRLRRQHAGAVSDSELAKEYLETVHSKRDKVKPRTLVNAENAYGDRKHEAHNLGEMLRMAEIDLRHFVEAEYPPAKSARLLGKYFPED